MSGQVDGSATGNPAAAPAAQPSALPGAATATPEPQPDTKDATGRRTCPDSEDNTDIVIFNLTSRMTKEKLETFLQGAVPQRATRVFKPPQKPHAFVTFETGAEAAQARALLHGMELEGSSLEVKPGAKRKRGGVAAGNGEKEAKKPKFNTADESTVDLSDWVKLTQGAAYPRSIQDIVTPLWEMPYETALFRKESEMRKVALQVRDSTLEPLAASSTTNCALPAGARLDPLTHSLTHSLTHFALRAWRLARAFSSSSSTDRSGASAATCTTKRRATGNRS
jgi:hypothetical protein